MKKQTAKAKRFQASRSRYQLKRTRSKRKYSGGFRPYQRVKFDHRRQRRIQPQRTKVVSLTVPSEFKLIENTDSVLQFISQFRSHKTRFNRHVFLDLRAVKQIDSGAICIMLSAVYDLAQEGISVAGNYPTDPLAGSFFTESGFFSHIQRISSDRRVPLKSNNLILKLGKDRTTGETFGKAIKHATKFITGFERHYNPVYTLLIEMSGNSVEHAYEEDKHWLLGVTCDPINKKVSFTFTDNGFGILNTIKKKFAQEIHDRLLMNDGQVLKAAFERRYGSRTRELNRNRGLPSILKTATDGKVANMILITNNTLLDFDNDTTKILSAKFAGTFYFWELNLKHLDCEKDI